MRAIKPKGSILVTAIVVIVVVGFLVSMVLNASLLQARSTKELLSAGAASGESASALILGQKRLAAELRNTLRTQIASATSLPSASTLASAMQSAAAGYCSEASIFFTSSACSSSLPEGLSLSESVSAGVSLSLPFLVVGIGEEEGARRTASVPGEYLVTVGNVSYARYAIFTSNNLSLSSSHLIEGPVYVGGQMTFSGRPYLASALLIAGCTNPSSVGCTTTQSGATFGSRFITPANMAPSAITPCYSEACPTLAGGVDYAVPFVAMPSSNSVQSAATVTTGSRGLYLNSNLASVTLTSNGGNTDIRICTTISSCINYTAQNNTDGTMRLLQGTTTLYTNFSGVIYAEGRIDALSGGFRSLGPQRITIGARDNILITSSLRYATDPCLSLASRNGDVVTGASCQSVASRLGIYSHSGNVLIASTAPSPLTLHASVMARNGRFGLDGGSQTVSMVGSIASLQTPTIPSFFTFDPGLTLSGPPAFPTLTAREVVLRLVRP